MACEQKKITDFTQITTAQGTDAFLLERSGSYFHVTGADLQTFFGSGGTGGGSGNTSILTDNMDGTYTHDDGTGSTTTITTLSTSFPTAPASGETLSFDGTNWVAIAPTSGAVAVDDLTDADTTTTTPVIGDVFTWDGTNWVNQTPAVVAPDAYTPLTTGAWDYSTGSLKTLTLTSNQTIAITNAVNGDFGTLIVTQDATGGHTLLPGVGNYVVNAGGQNIPIGLTPNAISIISWTYDGTAFYYTYGNDYTNI